jgi:large subunit ribosomal protein L23
VTDTLVLLRPIVTEKSMSQTNAGRYTFEVRKDATKQEIAEAVAQTFKVDVQDVNVISLKGKERRLGRRVGRTPDRKKAVVTVAPGQRIERYFVEGGV